jgi:integrase
MRVTIRAAKVNGAGAWVVDWRPPGEKRCRKYFPTKREAEDYSRTIGSRKVDLGEFFRSMSQRELVEWATVAEEAAIAEVTPRMMWEHYQRSEAPQATVSVGEAIKQLVAAKRAAGRRDRYVVNLSVVLDLFAKTHGSKPVFTITHQDLDKHCLGMSLGYRKTTLGRLSTLFGWCVRRGYATRNPCDRIDRITIEAKPPRILTLDEADKLISFVRESIPQALPWFALALFAGTRPEETDQIGWPAVNLETATLTIDGATSKVRTRRIVNLQPRAVELLTAGGMLPVMPRLRRRWQDAVKAAMGWPAWPKDILRHSCASYMLALTKDAPATALQLGNSPAILFRHYRELVSAVDAKRFFASY